MWIWGASPENLFLDAANAQEKMAIIVALRIYTTGLIFTQHICFDVDFLVGVRNVLAFVLFITRKSNFVGVGS